MNNPSDEIVRAPSPEKEKLTWEQQSGFLEFLGSVPGEVSSFNDSMEFGLRFEVSQPDSIDSDHRAATGTAFIVTRRNGVFPERIYCLYTLFRDHSLHAYIGVYDSGRIETLRELEPLTNFQEGASALYGWLRALIKASCEK
jgi:hypothetical protein